MDRVRGLGSFVLIAAAVMLPLRAVHLVTPLAFPSTRLGPITVASLGDVARLTGFRPMVPAYRPATLGEGSGAIAVFLSPRPTFTIAWRAGDQWLSVSERRGGARPSLPPLSTPLIDVDDSSWWMEGTRCHLVLHRGEFWIEIETTLPPSELKRFADTLAPY